MAITCWVLNCHHNNMRENCKFFRFPIDKKTKGQWLTQISRKNEPGSGARVCSCHFRNGKRENGPENFLHNEDDFLTEYQFTQKKKEKCGTSLNISNDSEVHQAFFKLKRHRLADENIPTYASMKQELNNTDNWPEIEENKPDKIETLQPSYIRLHGTGSLEENSHQVQEGNMKQPVTPDLSSLLNRLQTKIVRKLNKNQRRMSATDLIKTAQENTSTFNQFEFVNVDNKYIPVCDRIQVVTVANVHEILNCTRSTTPKTPAQRCKEYRLRKKLRLSELSTISTNKTRHKKIRKTPAQCSKEYRERKKLRQAAASMNPNKKTREDIIVNEIRVKEELVPSETLIKKENKEGTTDFTTL